LRGDACYDVLARAFAKSQDSYREGHEQVLREAWEHVLSRYLVNVERPKVAKRLAELAMKDIAAMSPEERDEFIRLTRLGREI
jgi:hypothetical protein